MNKNVMSLPRQHVIQLYLVVIFTFLILPAVAVQSESVDTLWLRFYEGPPDKADNAYDVVVDDSGNVYVTGTSQGIWPAQVFNDQDMATIKYTPTGDTVWVRRYDPIDTAQEQGLFIKQSANGHLYVVGQQYIPAVFFDSKIIRYNTNGDTIWTKTIAGSTVRDVAVADDGTICVATTISDGSQNDWFIVCYDSSGSIVWSDQVGTVGQQDDPVALAFDNSKNLYAVGFVVNVTTSTDTRIIKYTPTGSIAWSDTYNGDSSLIDSPSDIAIDNNQEPIVLLISQLVTLNNEVKTRKYSSTGSALWTRTFDGAGNGPDVSEKVGVDANNNIYISAQIWISASVANLGVVKYSSAGDSLLSTYFTKITGAADMEVDDSGNVHITEAGTVGPFLSDWGTVKFAPTLDTVWFRWLLNGTFPGGSQFPSALAVANDGDVVVTGQIHDGSFGPPPQDYATVRYTDTSGCCIGDRGDINGDGNDADLIDLTFIVDFIFRGSGDPGPCPEESDANGDGNSADLLDLTFVVDRVFRSGPLPGPCP